jgi:RecQ mediated genome instability protein
LEQCCVWIANEKELSVTEKFQEFFQHVHDQLLKSDLKDSMHHGTGLPELSSFTGNISGPPVLVQIIAIKEIGVSAFQLEQIRAAHEERILAGVGDEEGEEDGDLEVEAEGPMPKYPRGTLLLRLSDGATEFDAMEYRPIPQLALGVTKLGYKVSFIMLFLP